jgi:hypothetical protein
MRLKGWAEAGDLKPEVNPEIEELRIDIRKRKPEVRSQDGLRINSEVWT